MNIFIFAKYLSAKIENLRLVAHYDIISQYKIALREGLQAQQGGNK